MKDAQHHAILALPPFLTALFLTLRVCIGALGRHAGATPVIAAMAGIAIVLSVYRSNHILWTGNEAGLLPEGSNGLIRRASYVRPVERELLRIFPAPEKGAVFIFRGLDIWGFDAAFGPRNWYGRDDLDVRDFSALGRDSRGVYVVGEGVTAQKSYLSDGVSILRFNCGKANWSRFRTMISGRWCRNSIDLQSDLRGLTARGSDTC